MGNVKRNFLLDLFSLDSVKDHANDFGVSLLAVASGVDAIGSADFSV